MLDEMGYLPIYKESAELLFHLITDWYEKKSIIITSNLEFSQQNRIIVDPRLTSALVDRVIHHAHILTSRVTVIASYTHFQEIECLMAKFCTFFCSFTAQTLQNTLEFDTLELVLQGAPGSRYLLHSDRGFQYTSHAFRHMTSV